jgi:hypothetical protein
MIQYVPISVLGSQEANELLDEVASGMTSVHQLKLWADELRAEGFAVLAKEVELRLPVWQ